MKRINKEKYFDILKKIYSAFDSPHISWKVKLILAFSAIMLSLVIMFLKMQLR